MPNQAVADAAFERAWATYQLINAGLQTDESALCALKQYIAEQAPRYTEAEVLAVEALKFLRQRDGIRPLQSRKQKKGLD